MDDNSPNESALELRLKQITRYMSLGLLSVLGLSILVSMHVSSVQKAEDIAKSNQQVQAQITIDSNICQVYPSQELCVLARKIAANPDDVVIPKDGKDGKDGAPGAEGPQGIPGRGVASFTTDPEGNLVIHYTDGQTETAGRVVGMDGIDGANGRGILSTTIDGGNLIVRYSDGTSDNLGIVVGPQGDPGAEGATGADGVSVVDLKVDTSGVVTVYYSNNTSASAGKVIVNTITSMMCQNDTLTITTSDGNGFSATVDCTPDNIGTITK